MKKRTNDDEMESNKKTKSTGLFAIDIIQKEVAKSRLYVDIPDQVDVVPTNSNFAFTYKSEKEYYPLGKLSQELYAVY